ncbi:S-adenosylmethionine-dependent methyltransferase [Elasticomyces elasticus]|nr:S-adenosylmethionine-dependent methyltransferase [Elasticomyces elasticus]
MPSPAPARFIDEYPSQRLKQNRDIHKQISQHKSQRLRSSRTLFYSLVVPKRHVKDVKTALERRRVYDSDRKIRPATTDNVDSLHSEGCYVVPTNISQRTRDGAVDEILQSLRLADLAGRVLHVICEEANDRSAQSLMEKAVKTWLTELSTTTRAPDVEDVEALLRGLPTTYSIYKPMLLLPPTSFQSPGWRALLSACTRTQVKKLFETLATGFGVTHVATNAPIPLHAKEGVENIVRSPTDLSPLYGDFGPVVSSHVPTTDDLDHAFWVSAKQNSITQVWAPRYTMFSRGNITEKARLLTLPSVRSSVERGRQDGLGCAAVDLYAGIGYFAFSYLAAGVDQVLCWDVNAWSIEGLRRGAGANKWTIRVMGAESSDVYKAATGDLRTSRLLAFTESNELAPQRINVLRRHIPPIRHVNCGLLPTSRGSWETAVAALDPSLGGWLHLHENFAVGEIESKALHVRDEIQRFAVALASPEGERRSQVGEVVLGHIQRVKSYAPGVWHCVLDVHVPPSKGPGGT